MAILAADSGYAWWAIALSALAIVVYGVMTGLVVWCTCHDPSASELRQPDIWILMGGIAIATLAGDHIHEAGVEAIRPVTVITVALVFLWIAFTAWVATALNAIWRTGSRRLLAPGTR